MRKRTIRLPLLLCVGFSLAGAESLSLETALQEAMTQGASSHIEAEKKVKAQEFENQQWGSLWPAIEVYATAARAGQPVSNTVKTLAPVLGISTDGLDDYLNVVGNQFTYGVKASGPLFTFGKVSTAIKLAEMQSTAVSAQVRRNLQTIQSNVIDAYANTVLAEQRVGVLRRSRERALETFNLTERDFSAGKGMKSDVLLAKANIKSLEPDIIAAESNARLARQNLNRLIGRTPSDTSELDTNLALQGLEPASLDREKALTLARENRKDLKALEMTAKVYNGTAQIYQANYYPTIGYQGSVGMLAYEPEQLIDWTTHRAWSVGVAFSWTLFDGWASQGANRAQAAQMKSDARVYQYQASELSRSIEMDVDKAMDDLVSADSSLQSAMEGRDAAAEAVAFLHANYPGAALRLADILSAEESLRNAEYAVLASRITRTRAQAQLRIALGQDLVSVPEE